MSESASLFPETTSAEHTQTSLPAGNSMEGFETTDSIEQALGNGVEGETGSTLQETSEGTQDVWEIEVVVKEKKVSYIDFLKSPVITIRVGRAPSETTLSAHLALLQKSPWFAEACASFTPETPVAERIVTLPDGEVDAVGSLLEYLYTNEYSPRLIQGPSGKPEDQVLEGANETDVDEGGDHLLKHANVYTLAKMLQLPELRLLAHSKIHRINSTAKGELRYAKFVYQNTSKEDKTIRQPIASFWAHRSHVLRHEAEDEFRRMVLEFPQFAYDILSIVLDQKEKGKDKEHLKRPATGGPADDSADAIVSSTKTPRTGRKRPRIGF